jgi:methionyl-tRNA formyltransferase
MLSLVADRLNNKIRTASPWRALLTKKGGNKIEVWRRREYGIGLCPLQFSFTAARSLN